ncbi:asparagine synthetase B [Balneolaceae bacterium YR4-1]|uniref:Asparagine synthetase B n=1 Tax=Halalkalibaculum roseum TaxID=2709311 RepID=A0A6M1SVJ3_9BACT|nr:asparagine synthetase B [Halalkalibaculum roseum]NGP76146.1 asparagine synthetase B [Halalkalibaculum roseum]
MFRHLLATLLLITSLSAAAFAQQQIFIPMDATQSNHLKAYGVIFNNLQQGNSAEWLLNYRGGSFMTNFSKELLQTCRLKNVKAEVISGARAAQIIAEVEKPDVNTAVVKLDKAPKIAVYTPKQALPWDDAVTLALTYAEVEYDQVWDPEVLNGKLSEYDWLHLHHEDFTGQYGKFWVSSRNRPWYIQQVNQMEAMARELGFNKVSNEKKAVARQIKEYVGNGGFLFAMCSGTDTFDIALAAEGVDIAPPQFDGDPMDPDAQQRLDYSKTLAFTDFSVSKDPAEYEHADIDVPVQINEVDQSLDFFTLFEFSAKWDPVPTMLTQNHVSSVRGFYGQTTAFQKDKIKESVIELGESPGRNMVKYIHGNYGRGTFTFYAGHDPEDYTHRVNDPPTDLSLHTNSPGYRLILNNILFPAAKKKKRKT